MFAYILHIPAYVILPILGSLGYPSCHNKIWPTSWRGEYPMICDVLAIPNWLGRFLSINCSSLVYWVWWGRAFDRHDGRLITYAAQLHHLACMGFFTSHGSSLTRSVAVYIPFWPTHQVSPRNSIDWFSFSSLHLMSCEGRQCKFQGLSDCERRYRKSEEFHFGKLVQLFFWPMTACLHLQFACTHIISIVLLVPDCSWTGLGRLIEAWRHGSSWKSLAFIGSHGTEPRDPFYWLIHWVRLPKLSNSNIHFQQCSAVWGAPAPSSLQVCRGWLVSSTRSWTSCRCGSSFAAKRLLAQCKTFPL